MTIGLAFLTGLSVLLGGILVWLLADQVVAVLKPNPRPEGEPVPAVRRTRFGWEAMSYAAAGLSRAELARGVTPKYAFGVTAKAARRRVLREVRRVEEMYTKVSRDNGLRDQGFAKGEER